VEFEGVLSISIGLVRQNRI